MSETGKAGTVDGFSVSTHQRGDTVVLAVVGEVDLAVVDELWNELQVWIAEDAVVVVDCAQITFLDSMGLQTLLNAAQKADTVGARFALTSVSEPVRRVLDLAGVGSLITVSGPS